MRTFIRALLTVVAGVGVLLVVPSPASAANVNSLLRSQYITSHPSSTAHSCQSKDVTLAANQGTQYKWADVEPVSDNELYSYFKVTNTTTFKWEVCLWGLGASDPNYAIDSYLYYKSSGKLWKHLWYDYFELESSGTYLWGSQIFLVPA